MNRIGTLPSIACMFMILAGCQAEPQRELGQMKSGLEIHVPADYALIQDALNAATYEDTVVLAPGDYTENFRMRSGVVLQGSGPDQTRIHGQISFWSADFATLRGVTVTGDGASGFSPNIGIMASGDTFRIEGCVVEGFGSGIGAEAETIGYITGNLVRQNEVGIEFSEIGFAVYATNNVVLNNSRAGILIYAYSSPRIQHNTIVGNGFAQSYDQGGAGIAIGPFNNEVIQNNIIVSNKGGINSIQDSNSNNHHNLVWGNLANYVGDANVGAGDRSLDPLFLDAPGKDFRLSAGSPAIDAGVDLNLLVDHLGQDRPSGAAPDLGAFEAQEATAGGDLIISEVMANPTDESKGEFIELYNDSGADIDAAGLVLDDGDSSDVVQAYGGGSSVVPPGAYALILDPDYGSWATPYDIPAQAVLLTVSGATLGSGLSTSDPVSLSRGAVPISTFGHPFNPGNGISAERVDLADGDSAENWVASPCGSSPGAPNCISSGGTPGGAPTLIITEVMASPTIQSTEEFVELYNYGDEPVELLGLMLTDGDSSDSIEAVAGKSSLLPAGSYGLIIDPDLVSTMSGPPYNLDGGVPVVVTVDDSSLGNGLASNDPVSLLAADGTTVLSTFSHPMSVSGQSIERVDPMEADLPSNWMPCPCPDKHSAGLENCASLGGDPSQAPVLLITEVMANPLDEDLGEFIELFNPGDQAVDVMGLVFSDGDANDIIGPFPGQTNTTIPAGGYGVILDPEYSGGYTIPPEAIRLAPQNSTVGNGLATNDPITLLARDGVTVISSCSFPSNPGNGISLELMGDSGDVASNWGASSCAQGSSPGAVNCAGSGDPDPDPDPVSGDLVISEVLANPVDEYRGEFIEIVNQGTQTVDLAGYILSDGDATDGLVGYQGGDTSLAPGGIALVLDSGYPDLSEPYTIPAQALLLTTSDATLGSGLSTDDPITLLGPDGVTIVSTWANPFNPGNGISAERVDLAASDTADNWVASPCASGSSPGAANCADQSPTGQTVDVNTASAGELEQIGGIGPATANSIVNYRDSFGLFESLIQLSVIDGITEAKINDWMVAEEGEPEFVLGLADGRALLSYASISDLLAALPDPQNPGTWAGQPVRIQRAACLEQADDSTMQHLIFSDWGDESAFDPNGQGLPVFLDRAASEPAYDRSQTDHANAMADWIKEDGAPYLTPLFYRWLTPLWSYGALAYGHVYTLEGVLEVEQGNWRLRIRARSDAGIDRLVLIERWLPALDWSTLEIVWTYNYKPVVVESSSGYSYSLPYRLALAHPCRAYWFDNYGQWIDVPRCPSFGECGPMTDDWTQFNQALAAWRQDPGPSGDYCFNHDYTDYCFTAEEELLGVDILNNAQFGQLTDHCFTSTLANTILANRPFASIAEYDGTSGVGTQSLWNLLVCYVRSGDWPEAAPNTVAWVLQNTPDNEWSIVSLPEVVVSGINGQLFDICDEGSSDCMAVYSYAPLPAGLAVDAHVQVTGQVKYYENGGFWELTVDGSDTWVSVLSWDSARAPLAGDLVLNEVFADPQNELCDANCDGLRSAAGDEFLELVNVSLAPLLLDGVTISDSISIRHTFASGTSLDPGEAIVVFGGGPLMCPGFAQVQVELASSGGLSLNNTGDTLTVADAQSLTICTMNYSTEADDGQSLTLSPDLNDLDSSPTGISGYVIHMTADSQGDSSRFSPGTRVDGSAFIP